MKLRALNLMLLVMALCGCGTLTVTPPLNDEGKPYVDTSTPSQYPLTSSGILGESADHRWIYITSNRAKLEPTAVPYVDVFGNHVFEVASDAHAAQYAGKINAQATKLETTK